MSQTLQTSDIDFHDLLLTDSRAANTRVTLTSVGVVASIQSHQPANFARVGVAN